jgi:hypothetical protein
LCSGPSNRGPTIVLRSQEGVGHIEQRQLENRTFPGCAFLFISASYNALYSATVITGPWQTTKTRGQSSIICLGIDKNDRRGGGGNVQVCHPFLQELHRNIGRLGPLKSLLHLVHTSRPVGDDILMGRVMAARMSSVRPDGRPWTTRAGLG